MFRPCSKDQLTFLQMARFLLAVLHVASGSAGASPTQIAAFATAAVTASTVIACVCSAWKPDSNTSAGGGSCGLHGLLACRDASAEARSVERGQEHTLTPRRTLFGVSGTSRVACRVAKAINQESVSPLPYRLWCVWTYRDHF
jgi:hypothetical protein